MGHLGEFFLKCLVHHPHTIDHVARIAVSRKLFDDDLDEKKWASVALNQLQHHLDMGHDHEICWLLWITISLSIKLSDPVAEKLIAYPNAVVALMGMHARTLGLLKKTLDITAWKKRVNAPSLEEEWWLFAYECATKGWIKQQIDWTTIEDSVFERMKKAKVTFYRSSEKNEDVAKLKKGRPSIPVTGFGYDGEDEKGEKEEEEEDDFDADM